jgi:hypothetical protein
MAGRQARLVDMERSSDTMRSSHLPGDHSGACDFQLCSMHWANGVSLNSCLGKHLSVHNGSPMRGYAGIKDAGIGVPPW